jgi:nucleoside phosphorylase/CheY-like chemotaxis protein
MKILIVEDDGQKLASVAAVLRKLAGLTIEIETANDANQAKRFMSNIQYDIVILDITLPTFAGDSTSPFGGVELMKEIMRRPLYKKPREIIGLTAYENVLSEATPQFNFEHWNLIYYDPTSSLWAEQIGRKVQYASMTYGTERVPDHECDLCVITALPQPEFEAVKNIPWNWQSLSSDRDCTTYFEGTFEGTNGSKKVIAACAPQMGMAATAVLATKMVASFIPRYIAMVGIAAGVKGTCTYGDVICADPCWDWGNGKFIDRQGQSSFEPAPIQLRLDPFLRGKLTSFSQDAPIWDKIRRDWTGNPVTSVLTMHIAPFASGAAVISDNESVGEIRGQNRKLTAIDMEAYAMFAAAYESTLPQPKAFVLKSIVDFADVGKSDAHQVYSAYTSANALRYFAERYL